jgi:hypothetical protein
MKRLAILLILIPAVAHAKKPPVEPLGPPSKAITEDIVDAIAEEMNRAMSKLEIPGAPKPYSISYKITEVDVNDVAASLGQTTSRRNRHFVSLEARVRVGTQQFDNGNFVVPDGSEIDGTATANLPLEATPRIARRAAWLVTDQAYKEALIQLRAKIEARRAGGTARPSDVPAWTTEKPVVGEEQVLVPPLETLDDLEARAKKLSGVFRDQPDLRDSRVAVTSYLERRWYLTTEGTSVTDTRRASGIVVAARLPMASCSATTSSATVTPRRTSRATRISRRTPGSSPIPSPSSRRRRCSTSTAVRCCSRARAPSACSASRSRRTSAARRCPRVCRRRKHARSAARSPTRSGCG